MYTSQFLHCHVQGDALFTPMLLSESDPNVSYLRWRETYFRKRSDVTVDVNQLLIPKLIK